MKDELYISIDQSTSGTKVLLVGNRILSRVDRKHKQIYPNEGWVEHNPLEIYSNVVELIDEILRENDKIPSDISGISITNQRESIVAWDAETSEPVSNVLVWQCNRAKAICDSLIVAGYDEKIRKKTGLILDTYFSAPKLKWLSDNSEIYNSLKESGRLRVGTIDSWLVWKMTNGKEFVTDESNASRTMLYNIYTHKWDDMLLDLFNVNPSSLAKVVDSNSFFGEYKGIPIISVLADSQASLYANKCLSKGQAKATLGTGCSIMVNAGPINLGNYETLVETIAWRNSDGSEYAIEGVIRSMSDTLEWASKELELFDSVENEIRNYTSLNSNGVMVIPGQLGLGTPYWNTDSKASIHNMTRNNTKKDIIAAFFLSVIFQIYDNIEEIEFRLKSKIICLRLDGGLSRSSLLMQSLSNLIGLNIEVSDTEELSAIGALSISGKVDFEVKYEEYKPKKDDEIIIQYSRWRKLMIDKYGGMRNDS